MSEAVNSVAAEEKKTIVTKKDLLKAWWKWTLAVEVPVSFDRMQALAFGYSMNKVLRKLYKDDPEELQAAMRRHTSMFNTNCDWGSIIHGITISLEEQRALGHDDISPEVIQSLKLGLMGPLAGIGDSVSKNSVLEILHSGAIKKVIDIASIVGLFMIGCLSASYIKVQTIVEFASDTSTVKLQEIIDGILPNMLPFIVVMGMYLYITKRGPKYIRLMIYTMIIAIVLTFFHII